MTKPPKSPPMPRVTLMLKFLRQNLVCSKLSYGTYGVYGVLMGAAAHITKLRALLPRFPMTMKGIVFVKLTCLGVANKCIRDVKGRTTPLLPYTVAASPDHFLNLNYGRRKAIEVRFIFVLALDIFMLR